METIWHLTVSGEPADPGAEGFVHCSFTGQLAGTLQLHFADANRVTLLRLDPETLGDALRLEPSRDGQIFPHVHAKLPVGAILDRITVVRGADGHFNLSAVPS